MILVYRLKVIPGSSLQVSCFALDITKGSKWTGTAFHLSPDKLVAGKKTNVRVRVTAIDRKILMTMVMNQKTGAAEALFRGPNTSRILEHLIACGRAYPTNKNALPLTKGEKQTVSLGWAQSDNSLLPTVDLDASLDLIPGNPCFAVERETGRCFELSVGTSNRAAWSWVSQGALPVEKSVPFLEKMQVLHPGGNFPPPPSMEVVTREDIAPVPIGIYRSRDTITRLPDRLELHFLYESTRIPFERGADTLRTISGNQVFEIKRDLKAEAKAARDLKKTGLVPQEPESDNLFSSSPEIPFYVPGKTSSLYWPQIIGSLTMRLKGWEWDLPEEYRPRIVKEEDWYVDYHEKSSHQIQYNVGILVNGERVPILPVLQQVVTSHPGKTPEEMLKTLEGDAIPLSTPHGLLFIPGKRIKRILSTIFELTSPDALDAKGSLLLDAWRATEVFEKDAEGWKPSPLLRKQVKALKGKVQIEPLPAPESFQGQLRPYQKSGLGWLCWLYEYGLGGVLADDMGLGKTVQVSALLLELQARQSKSIRTVIVSPASVLPNWKNELRKFAPSLSVRRHHGPERSTRSEELKKNQVIITTYGTLLRDLSLLNELPIDVVVLDEAQVIKNPQSKISKAAKDLNGSFRLALSGTPLENHLVVFGVSLSPPIFNS